MNVLRKILVGLGSIVVVALVLALAAPKTVRAVVSTLVTVTNTTSQPVPTMAVDTRNVNVVNTPNVNVASLPAVQLSGAINANISNTSANPVPTIPEQASKGFSIEGSCQFSGNSCTANPLYTVPTGETAVIESFTEFCRIDAGTALSSIIVGFLAPGETASQISVNTPATAPSILSSAGIASGGQNLKAYAAAGGIVAEALAASSENPVNDSCQFTLSGYLVP
jgi:hypothetical protein